MTDHRILSTVSNRIEMANKMTDMTANTFSPNNNPDQVLLKGVPMLIFH